LKTDERRYHPGNDREPRSRPGTNGEWPDPVRSALLLIETLKTRPFPGRSRAAKRLVTLVPFRRRLTILCSFPRIIVGRGQNIQQPFHHAEIILFGGSERGLHR
jgi:hypothetical protein